MATFDATEIIVWERANKLGKWCPYSSRVCQFLEENHRRDTSIRLSEVDESLGIYTINFGEMVQISDATGTKMPIRRRQCDKLGALGRGFSWQFLDDDNTWNSYDVDINNFIDCAFLEGKKSISLGRKFHGYHYEINFVKMIQVNKHTKRKRKIRRFEITSPYPLATHLEDAMDVSEKDLNVGDRNVLSPQFLNEEIPGTKDLEIQVNAYKRNAEGFEYMNHSEEIDDADRSKHIKFSANEEQGGISNMYAS